MSTMLSVAQMRKLLQDALDSALDTDAHTLPASMLETTNHRPVLFSDYSVVRAAPGMGKSLWARVLTDPGLRAVAAREFQLPRLERTEAAVAYGARAMQTPPDVEELDALINRCVQPVALWTAVALTALGVADLTALTGWSERVDWLTRNPGAPQRAVAELDTAGRPGNTVRLVTFDALDHLHPDRGRADHLISGILQLAADLTQMRTRVRAKVFIRPDILDSALPALTPTSRKALRTTDLTWGAPDRLGWQRNWTPLYGLLIHLLGNHASREAAVFRAMTSPWEQNPDGRFTAPNELRTDPTAQQKVFALIADPYMGANFRNGLTYHWLPTYLQDAHGQVTPRSFLTSLQQALVHAAEEHPGHDRALHHQDIRSGQHAGIRQRADHIACTTPWVQEALEPLAGKQVPIEQDTVVGLWALHGLTARLRDQARARVGERAAPTGPRYPDSYPDLVEELIAIGVMKRRTSGLLDLPDLYRVAHRLGRRGGVPRTASVA